MFERAPKEQIQSIEIIIASNEDKRMEKRILHVWNNIVYIISRLKIFENFSKIFKNFFIFFDSKILNFWRKVFRIPKLKRFDQAQLIFHDSFLLNCYVGDCVGGLAWAPYELQEPMYRKLWVTSKVRLLVRSGSV